MMHFFLKSWWRFIVVGLNTHAKTAKLTTLTLPRPPKISKKIDFLLCPGVHLQLTPINYPINYAKNFFLALGGAPPGVYEMKYEIWNMKYESLWNDTTATTSCSSAREFPRSCQWSGHPFRNSRSAAESVSSVILIVDSLIVLSHFPLLT